MKVINIFDPAMCCPTGVCGTDVDTKLVQLASFLNSLDKSKFEVNRYGLSTHPEQYVLNEEVSKIIKEDGIETLPLIYIDNKLIFSKDYPSIPELSSKLGLSSFVAKF